MRRKDAIKDRFIQTKYKQFMFIEEEDHNRKSDPDEPNWSAMGLTPQGNPLDEDFDEDDGFDFEWVDITIDRTHVWAVSNYDGDTIIWIGSRSLAIDMEPIVAIETFLYRNLDISE